MTTSSSSSTIYITKGFLPALLKETNFRHVIFTQPHEQWVFMNIRTNDEIPWEMHTEVDQYFMCWGDAPSSAHEAYEIQWVNDRKEIIHQSFTQFDLLIVRHGTYHRIVNPSSQYRLRLLTVYSAAQHPEDRIQPVRVEEPAVDLKGAHEVDSKQKNNISTTAAVVDDSKTPVIVFPRYFTRLVDPFQRGYERNESVQRWIANEVDRGHLDFYSFHLIWKIYVLPPGSYQITGRHTSRSFLVTYGVATLQSLTTSAAEKEVATYIQGGDYLSVPARASCILSVPKDYLILVVLQEKDKVI
jgi:mannose-6-phosphate isomerase-like protein (cupin superfamily)